MAARSIPTVRLPSGAPMPVYGLGTWRMGESGRTRADEVQKATDQHIKRVDEALAQKEKEIMQV